MSNLTRAMIGAALFGFAGIASASDLSMCFAPQPVSSVGDAIDVTTHFLSCVVNALVGPA